MNNRFHPTFFAAFCKPISPRRVFLTVRRLTTSLGLAALVVSTSFAQENKEQEKTVDPIVSEFQKTLNSVDFKEGEILSYFRSGRGTTNSPLKVKGGAMTFRTKTWKTDSAGYPCAVLRDSSDTTLELVDVSVGFNPPSIQIPSASISLTAGWVVKLHLRDGTGTPEPDDKARVEMKATTTCGGANGTGIVLISYDDNGAQIPAATMVFYDPSHLDEDGTVGNRFKHTSLVCGIAADQDACDRMSTIRVKASGTANPFNLHCLNGECTIGIGNP